MREASFLRVLVIFGFGAVCAAASPLACSSPSSGSGFGGDGGSGALGDGSSAGSLGGGDGGIGGGNSDGCSDAAKLVYVVDEQNGLHSFNPATLKFTDIGTLSCPTSGGASTPNSMAVDRSGTAWVNFSDNELFKVSTADATCTATTFNPTNDSSQKRWGMAFSSNTAGSTDETLFVVPIGNADQGSALSQLVMPALVLSPIGNFSDGLKDEAAELTGTGNGDLYGFVTTQPDATLAKIDKTTGATDIADQVPLTGVNTGAAFAFSFWGGDFWLYTSADGFSSQVTQYKASGDKSIDVVVSDTGFGIVGAGVSTCAPTAPPR